MTVKKANLQFSNITFRVNGSLFKDLLCLTILVPLCFVISFYLLTLYTGGDQIHYHKFYEFLKYAKLDEITALARSHVSSVEPLSAFVLWFGAKAGIDKNIYISILNVIMIVGLFLLARKHQASPLTILLLLTNVYLVVLMTGAERLKIAYIVLFYAGLFEGKVRFMICAASPFAHLQSLILLAGSFASTLDTFFKNLFLRFVIPKKVLVGFFPFLLMSTLGYLLLYEGILHKGMVYAAKSNSSLELVKITFLTIIALYISRRRWRMLLVLLPMFPAVAILGGDRVNMIAVTLVIYFLLVEKRINHPFMYLLMTYFSFKTVPFVINIILYSNGFT